VGARREDTVVLGLFRKWIIKHIDSWFSFAQEHELGVVAMEDIILVTGCHRTRSWTNIALNEVQAGAQLSLMVDVADASGANITWASNVRGEGVVHNEGPGGKVRGMQIAMSTDSERASLELTRESMHIHSRISCQT
jgi:hypothetical protein